MRCPPMFNTTYVHIFYVLKVSAGRKLRLSAQTAVQMLFRHLNSCHLNNILYGKNVAEQKFQVQRNGKTDHFSDPVSQRRTATN